MIPMGFHAILTLSYVIPALYLFIRVWQLFIRKEDRFVYVLVFALLFSLYPLSNMTGEESGGLVVRLTGIAASYLLPFFLYSFLLVFLLDILLLFNKLVKIIPPEKINHRKYRRRIFVSILSLSIAVVVAGIINFNAIRLTRYETDVPARSSHLKSLRIAFVSDFHLDNTVSYGFVRRYVRKVKEAGPDLLLYGGDNLEGDGERIEEIENMLREIKPVYGSWAVQGNHDRIGRITDNFFTRTGIILLRDSVVRFNNSFIVAGRKDNRRSRMSAAELLEKANSDLPVIVIDHRPTEPEQISRTSADIVFSGHTHNGQLFPINLWLHRIYELSYGYMKKNRSHFFVSSGIRLWGPPVRTTARSEIVIVDVNFIH
jgi:predicted MPP superfamily phosphohydrolase